MESLSAWVAVICISALCISILNLLSPNGSMMKIFKFVMGIFMICVMIIPLTSLDFNKFNISYIEKNEISQKLQNGVAEQEKNIVSDEIKEYVYKLLKKENIEPVNIEIITDIKDDNSISIERIEIFIERKDLYSRQTIIKLVEEELEIDSEVYILNGVDEEVGQ